MIKVYGKENCGNCRTLINRLDMVGIKYTYSKDEHILMVVGSKHRIMSAPIVVVECSSGKEFAFSGNEYLEIIRVLWQ